MCKPSRPRAAGQLIGPMEILVKTKTGNYLGAGTYGTVYISFVDSGGKESGDLSLDVWLQYDHQRGTEGEQSPRRWQKLSEVVRSYDVILSLDTLPEYQGEWYEVKIKSRHTTTSDTCHPTLQVSEVTVTSRNFRQLRTTSDTCHPTPQVSEVTVTSRNFRQLRTTSDTCHPTPQVSEVTVTSRNFRQLRTTSDTCHPTPQVSEVTVTSDFTPDNPQNNSEMVVTSDNFRQLLPP
ncbi:Arachidonate 5-lipoxygenase [Branchiostoma belcheri]|nr:Arachidonate 5-lipoxygenase [Branchiostoma belcheri]